MEISYPLYRLFFILFLKTCLNKSDGHNLTWEVEQKIYQYNEDISLFCQVENCCPEWAGWWKRISKTEITTIFIDVRNQSVDESSKYDGGTKKGGFFLVIRNVTRHDLNMAYVCTYGFQVSKEKMLTETNAFFDEHVKPEMFSVVNIDDIHKSGLHLLIPLALTAVAVVLLVPICIYIQICKSSHKKGLKNTRAKRINTTIYAGGDALISNGDGSHLLTDCRKPIADSNSIDGCTADNDLNANIERSDSFKPNVMETEFYDDKQIRLADSSVDNDSSSRSSRQSEDSVYFECEK